MKLKIGDYVEHSGSHLRGYIVRSTFGASVAGNMDDEDESKGRFKTLGGPIQELEQYWVRINEKDEQYAREFTKD